MFVCGVDYADFVIWTPIDCVVTRVPKDMGFIETLLAKAETIWRTSILPELLTRRLEMARPNKDNSEAKATTSKEAIYCVCRKPESGDMVGCDEWFHLTCLKLKRKPSAKTWYCKKCKRVKSKQ